MLKENRLRKHRGRFLLPLADPASPRRRPRHPDPPRSKRRSAKGRGRPPLPEAFRPESPETERAQGMRELMQEYGLPRRFPRDVQAECEAVAALTPATAPYRLDLGSLEILCIDPADARDHDDAVSLELLEGGVRRLGVHIADVAEFVPEGGALDNEARRRGNSTYFYLDTVPMLPPLLSGEICSLQEDRDRAAVSLFIDFDGEGKPGDLQLAESRIRVTRSLSYEEAEALVADEGAQAGAKTLRAMLELAEQLAARRAREGALQFDLPELRPVDEGEGVERFAPAPKLRSHTIVEEFMLAANHAVGGLLEARGLPHLRRVHESPDPEDVGELIGHLVNRGVAWTPGNPVRHRDYQRLAARVAERPDRERLLMRMLRSFKKAAYAERDLGHFGLAWSHYLHFTSPIRRYADLDVHRAVKELLIGEQSRGGGKLRRMEVTASEAVARPRPQRRSRRLTELARRTSETELNSLQAEREAMRLEMVLWARQRLGESFDAVVQAVFPTGLLLRLPECGVEGFMPAQFLGEEYFVHDEERELLRGERTGQTFAEGLSLRVRLAGANLFTRRLQFFLEDMGDAVDN